jgi:hypothetical protein
LYFAVGERLRLALERKVLPAQKFMPNGECVEISSLGIWAANATSVFCLGVLLESGEDGKVAALPVMIDKAAFEGWLTKLKNPSDPLEPGVAAGPEPPRKLLKLSKETFDAIALYVASHSYKLTREKFSDAVRSALKEANRVLAAKALDKSWRNSLLKPIKLQRGGNPSADSQIAADGAHAGLVTVIKECVLRS